MSFNKTQWSQTLKKIIEVSHHGNITEFSNEVGIARNTLSYYINCNKKNRPHINTVKEISKYSIPFGFSEEDIFESAGYATNYKSRGLENSPSAFHTEVSKIMLAHNIEISNKNELSDEHKIILKLIKSSIESYIQIKDLSSKK